jgi:hypothetical protein
MARDMATVVYHAVLDGFPKVQREALTKQEVDQLFDECLRDAQMILDDPQLEADTLKDVPGLWPPFTIEMKLGKQQ